jgi:hypothetical protein
MSSPSRFDRLTSLDQMMVAVSQRWPQDIGALAFLDGRSLFDPTGDLRFDAMRAAIASRLHLVPRFRRIISVPRRGLGAPFWTDAEHFDIRDHVVAYPPPAETDERGLLAIAERLRMERFDPTRPLWRMWFIPGLPDGRVAMFVKLHHSIADRVAAMTTVAALLALLRSPIVWTEAGLVDDVSQQPCLVAAGVGVRRVPLPARGHCGRDPVVPTVQPVLPRRRGAARRAVSRSIT